jgi:hypothetical protein
MTMVAVETDDESGSNQVLRAIRAKTDELCTQNGYVEAEALLEEQIQHSADWRRCAIHQFAHQEVRLSMAIRRNKIIGTEGDSLEGKVAGKGGKLPKVYSERVARECLDMGGRYLQWPLSNRKLLGDATLEDITAEATMYESHAKGNARNGAFMRLVEKRMRAASAKPSDLVRKVLDERTLSGLMSKAIKGCE